MKERIRVVHISTTDAIGGAARATLGLHRGLLELGHDSLIYSAITSTTDPSHKKYEPSVRLYPRASRLLRRLWLTRSAQEVGSARQRNNYFSDDRTIWGRDPIIQLPRADVFHFHWISDFVDWNAFIFRLPQGVPVVWTLDDVYPLTGGCHVLRGCTKYERHCGACPQLKSDISKDLSRRSSLRKQKAFDHLAASHRLRVIAPSQWMKDRALLSAQLSGASTSHILYGVDTEVFRPIDKHSARESLGIPKNAKVVLFIADRPQDSFKGLGILARAILKLQASVPDLFVTTVGAASEMGGVDSSISQLHLGRINGDRMLAIIYSVADVFVAPTLEDAVNLTVMEALSCGVPVVGSRVGGLLDTIQDGKNGLHFRPGEVEELASRIAFVLTNPDWTNKASRFAREDAAKRFSLERQAKEYEAVYRAQLGGREAS